MKYEFLIIVILPTVVTFLFLIANYIHWRMVHDRASDTTQEMIDLQFTFVKAQFGITEPSLR